MAGSKLDWGNPLVVDVTRDGRLDRLALLQDHVTEKKVLAVHGILALHMLFLEELGRGSGPSFGRNKLIEKWWESAAGQVRKEVIPKELHLFQRPCEQGREVKVGLTKLANPVEIIFGASN